MMHENLSDTHPRMQRLYIQLVRQATPAQKLRWVAEMTASVRLLMLAGLKQRYPRAGQAELHRRMADLLLGAELAERIYGPILDSY
jgi:hypothetical protein